MKTFLRFHSLVRPGGPALHLTRLSSWFPGTCMIVGCYEGEWYYEWHGLGESHVGSGQIYLSLGAKTV